MLTALLAEQEENDVAKRVHVQDDSYLYTQNALPYGVRLVTLNRVINQFDGLNRLVNMTLMCCVLVIWRCWASAFCAAICPLRSWLKARKA